MKSIIRIGMVQMNATVGDLNANKGKILQSIANARTKEVDIVIFPELAVCGYPPEDLLLKRHFVQDNIKTLRSIVKETAHITAIVGFVDTDKKGNIYNAAAIIHNKVIKKIYHKQKLPNYGVFDEARYFTRGEENFTFCLGSFCFGVSICEDMWDRKGICHEQVKSGAQVLINISASPFHTGKRKEREQMVCRRARDEQASIFYLNLVGGQDELVFDGGSFIVNNKGTIIASGTSLNEDFICADINTSSLGKKKKILSSPAFSVVLSFKEKRKRAAITCRKLKALNKIEEIYKALVLGTRDYVQKNGFQKVVVGLSGGIDSALTAVIAHDALGKNNVVGISMPSQYSSPGTQRDAEHLAQKLGLQFITVPIQRMYQGYLDLLKKEFHGLKQDATEENLQARIRGNILMAFSNKQGWLVLTTGNKSETAVGYCTLYGDMAGGFAVIKDVSKTCVYRLAQYRNRVGKNNVIPESIIQRAPSAELRAGQKDQDTLPPYSTLDAILEDYIERDKSFEEIVAQRGEAQTVRNVLAMVDRNEYKRRQGPPGIKITPKSFGRDRRLPITNRYRPMM
ncbi:MAG: NAD+ synthase [Candidatus Omnitrophica bacterium]|nr:NAD+ synthase [Candidatus Omnitrophota bacterium]